MAPKKRKRCTSDSDKTSEESFQMSTRDQTHLSKLSRTVEEAVEVAEDAIDIDIPDTINVLRFAESRASEIATIMRDIKLKGNKLSLQQLPHYMRRRAASHNPNRVPRRLREKAAKEITKAKKNKRPSRRYRRRPSNLLLDYVRRQKKNVWLETHIWFKKRFKVEKLWGYQIPLHPNDKNRRSAHKSVTQYAMLQDMSYLCCIQLEGPQDFLVSKLSCLTSAEIGLTFAAKIYFDGQREGKVFLYHPNAYPFQAIGPVSFLWQPHLSQNNLTVSNNDKHEKERKLLIWCHPSMYAELIDVLMDIFNMQKRQNSTEIAMEDPEACKANTIINCSEEPSAVCDKDPQEITESSERSNIADQPCNSNIKKAEDMEVSDNIVDDPKSLSNCDEISEIIQIVQGLCNTVGTELTVRSVEECSASTQDKQLETAQQKICDDQKLVVNGEDMDVSEPILKPVVELTVKDSEKLDDEDSEKKSQKPVKCDKNRKKKPSSKIQGQKQFNVSLEKKVCAKKQIEELMSDLDILDPKLIALMKTPESYSSGDVTMTLLKDHLVRHRLIGPRSLPILSNVLKVADVAYVENAVTDQKWWEDYYSNGGVIALHQEQNSFWSNLCLGTQIPKSLVIGLTVGDPRIDIPPAKRSSIPEKNMEKESSFPAYCDIPNHISHSPLWNPDVRNKVTSTKLKESELTKLRSKLLVPGSRLQLGREESRVPVVLIHQPGNKIGYGEGWDIIIPAGWSMAFWISFVYNGARAYGLRELKSTSNNAACLLFPFLYPDTRSGQKYAEGKRLEFMAKHLRYPPAKRPSFEKLGICNPFCIPWDSLINEWRQQFIMKIDSSGCVAKPQSALTNDSFLEKECNSVIKTSIGKYFVLRSKKEISKFSKLCSLIMKQSSQHFSLKNNSNLLEENFKYIMNLCCSESQILQALVCVSVQSVNRGKFLADSELYIPEKMDLLTLKESSSYGGPVEPVHAIDEDKCVKKSKKHKRKKGNCSVNEVRKETVIKESDRQDELCHPNISASISNCSRKLVGYLDSGGFSFASGSGVGIGHCSIIAIVETLKLCSELKMRPILLIRQQNSFQYRFAEFRIVENFVC